MGLASAGENGGEEPSTRSPPPPISPPGEETRTAESRFWKMLALLMVGITLLYAFGNLQIRYLTGGGVHSDSFAEDVMYKTNASRGDIHEEPTLTTAPQPADTDKPLPSKPNNNDSSSVSSSRDRRFPPFVSIMKNGDAEYFTYTPRGRPRDDHARQALIDEWGSWTFDAQRALLTEDFYQQYPNRDVPRDKFPTNAWQTDQTYLSKFLPEAVELVQRAQDAILAEYGQPATGSWEERTKMFALEHHPENLDVELADKKGKAKIGDQGGWTTPESWKGLKRRILHAIMTEDSFVFAMGGHSSAAGHGNHFQQSYTLQVQWILEAVFARLGVRHQARNFGNGGLGTVHNGLGAGSIYGPDVDMLMWDSSMTEGSEGYKDIMHRQMLLSGLKIPVLWTQAVQAAKFFHTVMGIPVGSPGSGRSGVITQQNNVTKIENEIPWAVRYMDCSSDINAICKNHIYDGVCWIDRMDVKPTQKQDDHPGGRAGWHPGNRVHQLKGRVLAFTILQALKETLSMWKDSKDYTLSDDEWHVTAQYEEARKKLQEHVEEGKCGESFEKHGLSDVCKLPLQSRTEFTPRAFPSLSNIRTLMPAEMLEHINPSEDNIYEGPDVFNPSLHPPEGAVDVLSIVEAGPGFQPVLAPWYAFDYYKKPKFENPPKVPVGKGVYLDTYAGDYYCDGSVDSWCDRGKGQGCLLKAHNDGRSGIKFDGFSGWVVMNFPDVRYGFIMVKMDTWHMKESNPKTKNWKSINNEGEMAQRRLGGPMLRHHRNPRVGYNNATTLEYDTVNETMSGRLLKKSKPVPFCDQFQLEYAIDGAITTHNITEFQKADQKGHIDRVVETFVLLNDRDYSNGEAKEVEAALRITGCGTAKTFHLTHVYWA